MSELTSCNYCNLKKIKVNAKREHKKVKIKRSPQVGTERYENMGGVDVFVNGKNVAWFMELPDHCCC